MSKHKVNLGVLSKVSEKYTKPFKPGMPKPKIRAGMIVNPDNAWYADELLLSSDVATIITELYPDAMEDGIYLGIRYVGREKKVSEKGHAPGLCLTRALVSGQREHIKRLTSRAEPEARGFYAASTPCAHGHNSLT